MSSPGGAAGHPNEDTKAELKTMLDSGGFLDGQITRLLGRSGRPLAWLLYTPNVTLSSKGNRLAAHCLLEQLACFGDVQLATFGMNAVSLLVGVIALSAGRYDGLIIRESPKRFGSLRQIDGPVRHDLPVVVVDDSLVSGRAFRNAASVLEEQGLQVDGVVCLVEFSGRGGREWAESLGYRVESVFDLWRDLRLGPARTAPLYATPPTTVPAISPIERCQTLPALARHVAASLLRGEPLSTVPAVVADCDASGGAFVSFRDVVDETRLVRAGFFSLDQAGPSAAASVAAATARCVRSGAARLSLASLPGLKLGVTCISQLEQIPLSQVDASRYGLIVRSLDQPWRIGAALPDTPGRESEAQQYHECLHKAQLTPDRPHQLYRYTVTKLIESGHGWHPYGTGSLTRPIDDELTAYLHGCSGDVLHNRPTAKLSSPPHVDGVAITIYRAGALVGIHLALGTSLPDCLQRAQTHAWRMAHDGAPEAKRPRDHRIVVSVLHHPHRLGAMTAKGAAKLIRASEHCVLAETAGRSGTVLPHIACHHGWDAATVAELALRNADPECSHTTAGWSTYQTSSWLVTAEHVRPLRRGFAVRRREPLDVRSLARRTADFILTDANENGGLPAYAHQPATGKQTARGLAGRVLLALTALAEAGELMGDPEYSAAARVGARRVLEGVRRTDQGHVTLELANLSCTSSSECHALLLLTAAGSEPLTKPPAAQLFAKVAALFRADGMVTSLPAGLRLASDHDLLPGLALTAVTRYAAALDIDLTPGLDRQLHWTRRRFTKSPRWLAAGWLIQGWAGVWRRSQDPVAADFALSVADWTIARQFRVSGAYLTGRSRRTGCFNTAYLAEGVAAALALSHERGDLRRERGLRDSLGEALAFVSDLVLDKEDVYCMPRGERLVGGVRASPVDAFMRIDQAAHTLRALLGALDNDVTEIIPRSRE